jgi:hypothetical protein
MITKIKTYFVHYPIFYLGYFLHNKIGYTFYYAYASFRNLFVFSKGKLNDTMSLNISKSYPPIKIKEVKGVLGNLIEGDVISIAQQIKNNGYYIFESKLDESVIEKLIDFSLNVPANLIPPHQNGTKKVKYNRNNILSPRYQFDEQDIFENKIIQEISFDPSLFEIAQYYLNCKPILDLTAMWWSAAFKKEASSEAAQLYHFDMDRIKFIKFFFYLTDVDSFNGPHCFIKGSHSKLPDKLYKDGRISDEEVLSSFSKDKLIEITGKKGSIIAVDTRGLHKGKVLEKGERLIFQVEFANSLFGAPYNTILLDNNTSPAIKKRIADNRYTYQRFNFKS